MGTKDDDYRNNYMSGVPLLTGGGEWKPKNLIDAISEIQQFYVIESKGQDIPSEFLTIEGTLGFFKIGSGSGFRESLFVMFLFPVFQFYLFPFVFHSTDESTTLLLSLIPFMFLLVNTGLCFYVSRYYVGTLTRKAINSLFVGRSLVLILKSLFMFTLYFVAAKLLTPERVWQIAGHFSHDMAMRIYYGVFKVLPHIVPATATCSIIMLISALLPYGSAYLLDRYRRRKLHDNQARVAGR